MYLKPRPCGFMYLFLVAMTIKVVHTVKPVLSDTFWDQMTDKKSCWIKQFIIEHTFDIAIMLCKQSRKHFKKVYICDAQNNVSILKTLQINPVFLHIVQDKNHFYLYFTH